VLFFATTMFSQRTVTKEVGGFDELKVFDLIAVDLIPSDENTVVIKGENTDDVKVINDNGKLKIRMLLEQRFNGDETQIEIYYQKIDVLDANEGAYIYGNSPITQNNITLRAQEGGQIQVRLAVNNAKVKSVTGGGVEAIGTAENVDITLNTGGVFEGKELSTKETKVTITAAGRADINASEKVHARVTAGGNIYIYGNPKEVDKKRLAGGRIKIMH